MDVFIHLLKRTAMEDKYYLHLAVLNDDKAKVKELLKAGEDINKAGFSDCTPLHIACAMGNVDMVEQLLQHGADNTCRTLDGVLPVHCLCAASLRIHVLEKDGKGRTQMMFEKKALLQSFGNTSSSSAQGGKKRVGGLSGKDVKRLGALLDKLLHNISSSAPTTFGETPLHFACQPNSCSALIELLLQRESDVMAKTSHRLGEILLN